MNPPPIKMLLLGLSLFPMTLFAEVAGPECEIDFTLRKSFFKSVKGDGAILCEDKKVADVVVRAEKLSWGEEEVWKGHGMFTNVQDLKNLYGVYVRADGHPTAVDSAALLTKGEVSLTLMETTESGVSLKKLTISEKK